MMDRSARRRVGEVLIGGASLSEVEITVMSRTGIASTYPRDQGGHAARSDAGGNHPDLNQCDALPSSMIRGKIICPT
jgi:hypothetical protein